MKKSFIVLISLGIFVMWAGSAVAIYEWVDHDDRGTFGDMFGAVNALFSGLAFAGLIYTISVQRQELSLQREAIDMQTEELKLQRIETAKTVDELEGQKSLLNLQIAMTTINELIKNKNKRLGSATLNDKGRVYQGIDGLRWVFLQNNDTLDARLKQHFEYYLNSFIYILQYIHDSDLTSEQKNILAKLLDTDTSDAEIYMLYKVFHNDQHQLGLLKTFEFDVRFDKIMEK